MQPTTDMYPVTREHQLRLQREGDQMRLAQLAQANRPANKPRQPLLAELGRQLSNLGQRLEQAASKPPSDVLAYQRK